MSYYENEQLADMDLNFRKLNSDIWKAREMVTVLVNYDDPCGAAGLHYSKKVYYILQDRPVSILKQNVKHFQAGHNQQPYDA